MTAPPPKQFGPYQLVSLIATGGMAEIYLARTRGLGGFEKIVALKMIHPNYSSDDHFVRMLVDEAKISVQLQHVNIAHTFDLGRVDSTYYIAMEYVDGWDLFRILRRASEAKRPMPVEMCAYIAREVLSGLDYAHRKRDDTGRGLGIVHRDVSPQNVLISRAGEVKLVDFGIAKASMRAQKTAAGVIKGKYYYMSPEQAWGDPLDPRTDIFSAGVLTYEMLSGQMLYLEEDMQRLLDRVRKADIPPVTTRRPDAPREVERAVMRALAKKPDMRWQYASEFAAALERWLHLTAPDFSPHKLAAWVGETMGDPTQPAPPESIMARGELSDENSVIFTLGETRPAPPPPRPAPPPPPRPVSPDRVTAPAPPPATVDETVVSPPPSFAPSHQTLELGTKDLMEAGQILSEKTRLSVLPPAEEDATHVSARSRRARRMPRRTPPVAQQRLTLLPPQDTAPVPAPRITATEEIWPARTTTTLGWGTGEADDSRPYKLGGNRARRMVFLGAAVGIAGAAVLAWFALRPRPAPPPELVSAEVISIPPGARVTVDGRAAGTTPMMLAKLRPGAKLELGIELDRHEPWERSETVPTTASYKLIASLRPILGVLSVQSLPLGAEVFLNNMSIGVTPLEKTDMNPFTDGAIEVRRIGYKPVRQPLVWEGKRRVELHVELLRAK